jgi:hypothetical protein
MMKPKSQTTLPNAAPGVGQGRVAGPLEGETLDGQVAGKLDETPASNAIDEAPVSDDAAANDTAGQLAAAMKLVADLRKEAAAWRVKLRDLEKADADRKAQEEEARLQELSEVERLREQLAREQAARNQLEASLKAAAVTKQITEIAARLEFVDPSDAVVFIGVDAAEVDGEGKVIGVEEALVKLLEQKPHLKKAATQPQQTSSSTTYPFKATSPSAKTGKTPEDELKQRIFGRPETQLFEGGGVVWRGGAPS